MTSLVSKNFSGGIKKSACRQFWCVINAGTASEICVPRALLWCISQTVARIIYNLSILLVNKQGDMLMRQFVIALF